MLAHQGRRERSDTQCKIQLQVSEACGVWWGKGWGVCTHEEPDKN